jgi:hypothetical protein
MQTTIALLLFLAAGGQPEARPTAAAPSPAKAAPAATVRTAPPARPAPRKAPPPVVLDANTLYSWSGEDGSLHFTHGDEVPPERATGARAVSAGVGSFGEEGSIEEPAPAATPPSQASPPVQQAPAVPPPAQPAVPDATPPAAPAPPR